MKSKQQMIQEYRKYQEQLNELQEEMKILEIYLKGISSDFEELVADEWTERTEKLARIDWAQNTEIEVLRDLVWDEMCQEYKDEKNPIHCSLTQNN